MRLNPRYGEPKVLRASPGLADPATPLLGQRARLAELLGRLDDQQWATPSRCEDWSVQDVTSHLVSTNQFWAFSIDSGLKGDPTQFLATFDPVASPAQMVEASRSATPAETLSSFVESNSALAVAVERVGDAWSTVAEAPPGHLAMALVAQHALWDSWVHERDIVLPLGMEAVVEPDEVAASIAYGAALSPTFLACVGSTWTAAIELLVTDPDIRVVVDVGPQVVIHDGPAPEGAIGIRGDAVEVLEALSHRRPFPIPLADSETWILDGLAQAFDTSV